jgi:hypothetical protein
MKKFLTVALTVAAVALCSSAYAGQIWTDGNGDGLADDSTILAAPSTNVTVGVWFDAQSFVFTNFLAYVEWSGDCISYVSASYVITGGANFPIDNFSHPRAIGFGGSGFNRGGVAHAGNIVLHINTPVSCCVTPIIDVYNPFYVFSQLGAGSAYQLFTTNPGTCYNDIQLPTGACCFPDFSCIAGLTAEQCAAQGGNQWNQDQDCTSCPQPPEFEACCFIDGSCVEAQVGQCPSGSQPQGSGTNCAGVNCPDLRPRQACCFPDGSCVEAIVGECPAGSTPQPVGTNCSPNICPQPPEFEACCFPDGSCVDAIVGQCPPGSLPRGAGTSCATEFCPDIRPREACCFPDGSCVVALLGQCPAGSVGQGAGTNCSPNLCPQPQFQACCFADGSCVDAPAGQCPPGSTPQAIGTSCATFVCPQPPVTGACCRADGTCEDNVEAGNCDGAGETFFPNTPCSQVTCPGGTAVEPSSWGNIKGLYR